METNINYYFYRMYERDDIYIKGKNVIYQDVIKCENRNKAKQIIIDKHGDYPFRKPKSKDNDINNWYWLTNSDEFYYKKYHDIYHIVCDNCGKEIDVESRELYYLKNFCGEYCCEECKKEYTKKYIENYKNQNPWISENDHTKLVDKYINDYGTKLVGYIYRITNKVTMKSYIGKTTKPPLFRWWQHLKNGRDFEHGNDITNLLFEVLEVVTYNEELEKEKYSSGSEKLSYREMFYITHNKTYDKDIGYNKMIEKSKIEDDDKYFEIYGNYQLSLNLEEG